MPQCTLIKNRKRQTEFMLTVMMKKLFSVPRVLLKNLLMNYRIVGAWDTDLL